MKYSLSTLVQAPKAGWQPAPSRDKRLALYTFAADSGFDGIEWSPRWLDFHRFSHARLRSLKSEVNDHGLCISGINLNRFYLTGSPEAYQYRERLRRTFEVAEVFEAETVVLSLGMAGEHGKVETGKGVSDLDFARTVELLRQEVDFAGESGITLTLELHDSGPLDTAELALRMVEIIGRARVGINPDLGNIMRDPSRPQDWRQALTLSLDRMTYWHVKNYSMGKPSPLWEGDIDYREAFTQVYAHGYRGWISIESFYGDRQLELQKASLDWLRRLERGFV
ncbi:MAG: sugar phosphate isomerase/epimerase [Verrucomicrobiae bacterium]|nr:sugar phosphate isomerase/epimerase [Verrucomicrobiae bacterium]